MLRGVIAPPGKKNKTTQMTEVIIFLHSNKTVSSIFHFHIVKHIYIDTWSSAEEDYEEDDQTNRNIRNPIAGILHASPK